MFIAIALLVSYLVMIWLLGHTGMSQKVQHEWFIAITGGISFIYILIAGLWVAALMEPYGQTPDFPLWPYVLMGIILAIGATCSSIAYNEEYGITLV